MNPFKAFDEFSNWFDTKKKIVFFSGLAVGVLTHLLLLTHMMMCPDGLISSLLYSAGDWEVSLGRWGIDIVDSLRGNRSVSAISSLVCIVLAAASSVFLYDALNLKSKLAAFLTGVLFVLSPAFTITLYYEYTSDAYLFGLFFSVLAVWFAVRMEKKIVRTILSALSIMLSLAMYQSYFGITVATFVMVVLCQVLSEKENWKDGCKRLGYYVGTSVLGLVFYFISVKIQQMRYDVSTADYNGASSIGVLNSVTSLPTTVKQAYKDFVYYFMRDDIVTNDSWYRDYFFLAFFVAVAVAGIYLLVSKKLYKKPAELVMILVLAALMPVFFNIIDLMAPASSVASLSCMQMMLVIPFGLAVLEMVEEKRMALVSWVAIAAALLVMLTYCFADIYSHAYMKMTYDQAVAVAERIVDRMENMEGYYTGMPVMISGIIEDGNYQRDDSYQTYTVGGVSNIMIFHGGRMISQEGWRRFLILYLGMPMNFVGDETYLAITETEEFENMGVYPDTTSVQIIDGVMVVKLQEDVFGF